MAHEIQLQRLIYISHAVGDFTAVALDGILGAARKFNPGIGVTGLLLYHDGNFIQVIEGAPGDLETLMAKIRLDRRHGGIITMQAGPIARRAFPDWSMGYLPSAKLSVVQREGFINMCAYADDRSGMSSHQDAGVQVQVDAFLSTFREFDFA